MRTTVTLEPDVAKKVKELARRKQSSFKAVLNEVIRRGLVSQERSEVLTPFAVTPHAGGFRPGVDPGSLNRLVDELETEDFVRESGRKD